MRHECATIDLRDLCCRAVSCDGPHRRESHFGGEELILRVGLAVVNYEIFEREIIKRVLVFCDFAE